MSPTTRTPTAGIEDAGRRQAERMTRRLLFAPASSSGASSFGKKAMKFGEKRARALDKVTHDLYGSHLGSHPRNDI